jgi:putative DNA-invertase from lambdoid prophage Rac
VVILYARVSTTDQSYDSQLTELREYASRRGWTQVEEIVDTVSGVRSARKGLDRLMALVRRGKIDIVAVYKLDRLGRSLSHLAGMIDEFSSDGVGLISVSQGIDTSANNARKAGPVAISPGSLASRVRLYSRLLASSGAIV